MVTSEYLLLLWESVRRSGTAGLSGRVILPAEGRTLAAIPENGIDYEEFAWIYDRIFAQELNDRIEWELAVYAALNQLEYALKISESEFELYDGSGEKRYFSFNSEQNAQRVLLKLLFPLNV